MQTFKLSIITPDATLFEGEVISAIFPGADGTFETLAHHAPLVAMLKQGAVIIEHPDRQKQSIAIQEGFLEFHHNQATLLGVKNSS